MITKLAKDHQGQAILELALVLPILLLLVFGTIEFGRIYSTQLIITNSAREGARMAAVGSDNSHVISAIENYASIIDPGKLTIEISPVGFPRTGGSSVTVSVTYPVTIYSPIISGIITNPFPVSGNVVMRVE